MNCEPRYSNNTLSDEEATAIDQLRSLSPAVREVILALIDRHARSGLTGNVVLLRPNLKQ